MTRSTNLEIDYEKSSRSKSRHAPPETPKICEDLLVIAANVTEPPWDYASRVEELRPQLSSTFR
jgi:hypothetical protein